MVVPKYIFVVPYRDREGFMNIFLNHMPWILEDIAGEYEILFSHQKDTRPFNRGAMKNLGFYYARNKYKSQYKDINFVFQDVDTLPCSKGLMDFETVQGSAKHYYGVDFALGGIVSMKGEDFEKINGFPNFWGWGLEDNVLQQRCLKNGITINRDQFYKFNNKNITQYFTGANRVIDNSALAKAKTLKDIYGISEFYDVKYNVESLRVPNTYMVNFTNWEITEKHTTVSFRNEAVGGAIRDVRPRIRGMNTVMGHRRGGR